MVVVTRFNGLAPEYEGRPSGPILPALTSLFGANGDAIRLRTNEAQTGYRLIGADGLGAADMQNTIEPSAQGGGSIRHRRYSEGSKYLLVKVAGASTGELQDMVSRLVALVTGGATVISVWDPVSQEYRSKEVFYESGLGAPEWKSPLSEAYGITFAYVSPFWRGPERVVVERIAPPVKPLITADPGQPIDRWPDPEFSDGAAYAPWLSSEGSLVKWGTGDRHGGFFSSRLISVVPGDVVTVEAALSFVAGPPVGHVSLDVRALDAENQVVVGSQSTLFSESYAGSYAGEYTVPAGAAYLVVGLFTEADVHSTTQARVEALSVRRAGDEIVGAYSFPFFPVFLADSTVQGEHELTVEGDAPVWPVWEITGPGRDVEIIGLDGSRLFVEGEVTSPITIVTEPGKRSIRDASGLIWERMKPGDDQFFALEPGEQTVKMTMVGGNPESTIRAVYSENWKTPRGTAQGMIRGGVV